MSDNILHKLIVNEPRTLHSSARQNPCDEKLINLVNRSRMLSFLTMMLKKR